MPPADTNLFLAMWVTWLVYWLALAGRAKVSTRREPWLSRVLHLGPLVLAGLLLGLPSMPIPVLGARFLPPATWAFWSGAVLTAGGLLFTVWARQHIGRNWSAIVTIKQDHELITTGPYAIVRHPIYTGLLLAFAGSALALGEWRGVLAVAIVFLSLWRKLGIEERWMREHFGESYQAYSQRVAALVPFLL